MTHAQASSHASLSITCILFSCRNGPTIYTIDNLSNAFTGGPVHLINAAGTVCITT